MSESIKVTKLDKVVFWFEENVKKFLAALFLSFMTFSVVALIRGIGYEARATITSIEPATDPLAHGQPIIGHRYWVTGDLICTFNPCLYPVSHIFGYENNSTFIGLSEPYDSEGVSVKETAEISMMVNEFFKNIPYYLAISLIAAFGSIKLIVRAH